MNRLQGVAAAFFTMFLSSLVLSPFVHADWIMFHSDASHSGASSGTSVLTPTELWSYTTGGLVESSPSVVGGVVYVGSYDHNVYALNATSGVQLWNYTTGNWVWSSPAVVNDVVYIGSDGP